MSSKKSKRQPTTRSVAPPATAESAPLVDRTSLLVLAGLVLVTLAAYFPVWHGGMLWDDDAHLTRASLRSLSGLWRIWFDLGATQQFYPVAHSAFWVMHRLWGDSTLGYHLVNIVLHACSAWLVFLILRRLAIPGAMLAAAIFALHPVEVESVAWMTELKNTLSGVCYLAAMLTYLKFDSSRARRAYLTALALFVLALLSKTVTATLPAALLVVFWWQRGTLRWREDVVPLVPFFGVGVALGLLTAWVERTQIGAEGAAFQFTIVERCLIAGRAFWFYLGKLAWPANLTFIYPRWHVSQQAAWQFVYPLLAIALAMVLWMYRKRSRAPLAAILFFAGTLFPALGFFNVYPFLYSFVADHFQYLAGLGPIVLFAAAVATIATRWPIRSMAIVAAAAFIVCAPAAVLTWNQTHEYADAETLYRTTLERNPDCWMAYINLGKLRQDEARGRGNDPALLEEARSMFQKAVSIDPGISQAHNNLGTLLLMMGRDEEALAEFRKALDLKPSDPEVHQNMSLTLQRLGRTDEAAAEAQASLKLRPNQAAAHLTLADALQSQGRLDEAIREYAAALLLAPDDAEARNNYGSALAKAGRLDEAAAQFQEGVRLNPLAFHALNNLGSLELQRGRPEDAAGHFRAAIAIQPDFAPAYRNLGTALDAMGRHDEAIGAFREAIEYQPDSAEAHNDLGIALAETDRFQEAVVEFREAVRLKPDFADARANLARAQSMIK
jgi:tetratricopeptide (TPR) repeat protein